MNAIAFPIRAELANSALVRLEDLLPAIENVNKVIEIKNTLPILRCISLKGNRRGFIEVSGTDLDMTSMTEVKTKGIDPTFAVAVETKAFSNLLKKIASSLSKTNEILLSLVDEDDKQVLKVITGKLSVKLQCHPAAEYPHDAVSSDILNKSNYGFTMTRENMLSGLMATTFCISQEETRYYLNGVFMHAVKDEVRFTATDGHRLGRYHTNVSADIPDSIIPRKTILEVQRLLSKKDTDENVVVSMTDTKVRFVIGNVTIVSKLIDGTFPDYQRVIPTGNEKKVVADPTDIIKAVSVVTAISQEKGRAVKLQSNKDGLTISLNNPGTGNSSFNISNIDRTEHDVEVGINAHYLSEILTKIEGYVTFKMDSAADPILISPYGNEQTLYVLMPMRI